MNDFILSVLASLVGALVVAALSYLFKRFKTIKIKLSRSVFESMIRRNSVMAYIFIPCAVLLIAAAIYFKDIVWLMFVLMQLGAMALSLGIIGIYSLSLVAKNLYEYRLQHDENSKPNDKA